MRFHKLFPFFCLVDQQMFPWFSLWKLVTGMISSPCWQRQFVVFSESGCLLHHRLALRASFLLSCWSSYLLLGLFAISFVIAFSRHQMRMYHSWLTSLHILLYHCWSGWCFRNWIEICNQIVTHILILYFCYHYQYLSWRSTCGFGGRQLPFLGLLGHYICVVVLEFQCSFNCDYVDQMLAVTESNRQNFKFNCKFRRVMLWFNTNRRHHRIICASCLFPGLFWKYSKMECLDSVLNSTLILAYQLIWQQWVFFSL